MLIPYYFYPQIEFTRFKKIDFFPPRMIDFTHHFTRHFTHHFTHQGEICLGTKSRALGDALVLTPLAEGLKKKYPHLKIRIYPRGFNPVVFANNPWVDGISYLPDSLYGDDCNWDTGHLIQLKQKFFDLPVDAHPHPRLYLTEREKIQIESKLNSFQSGLPRPLCIIHPWGSTQKNILSLTQWQNIVSRWSGTYDFWQVGIQNQPAIPGCQQYFFFSQSRSEARTLFTLFSKANLFLGVDSGPMHLARAFDIPSFIFINVGNIQSILESRTHTPYFLNFHWKYSFLYEENSHCSVLSPSSTDSDKNLHVQVDEFMSNAGVKGSRK